MDNEHELKVQDAQVDYNRRYTYADYIKWDDDTRWELIDGVPYMMSAPTTTHQGVSGNLLLQLASFLKGKQCKVFHAPVDVRLNADGADDTVVQPDIVVICDRSKIEKASIVGAPDMVVEILSPSTSGYDKVTKFNRYLRAGIKEYWIIDPEDKYLAVHALHGESYIIQPYSATDMVPVLTLDGCEIDLKEVFFDIDGAVS